MPRQASWSSNRYEIIVALVLSGELRFEAVRRTLISLQLETGSLAAAVSDAPL